MLITYNNYYINCVLLAYVDEYLHFFAEMLFMSVTSASKFVNNT